MLEVQDELISGSSRRLSAGLKKAARNAMRKRADLSALISSCAACTMQIGWITLRAISASECAHNHADYPSAAAMLAHVFTEWALHPGSDAQAALSANRASHRPADSWCHLVAGQIDMYRRRLDEAEVHHRRPMP